MGKKIVFCADGTWNHPGETDGGLPADTNVYKFFKALLTSASQLPFYDDGVGSDGTPVDRLLGGAIGQGLFEKIKEGYAKVAHVYDDGDQIFLFGFSRGAYTVRSLAGMIAVCGLPTPEKFTDQAVEDAFDVYRDKANRATGLPQLTAKYACRDVKIDMVGVWDTVGSLGIPGDVFEGLNTQTYGFLDTSLHPDVKNAHHALAVDERRSEFLPTLWTGAPAAGQTIEQVWFAGVHCDVGGGYAETGLSDTTLGWMMEKARALDLDFDPKVFAKYSPIAPKHGLDSVHESWNPLWGFPTKRQIAAGSTIASSVGLRIQQVPAYRPPNLPSGFPASASGLQVENLA
jgi:uncharacterized protein (DUF2235 family)